MRFFLIPAVLIFFAACNSGPANNKTTVAENKERLPKTEIPNPFVETDASAMDMSYYPVDYPTLKMNHLISTPPLARVIYSRPHKGGRKIFGGLVPYNKQWRLGANEASEIEFFKPAIIQNKKIAPGRYIIYSIPQETKWTILLNKDIFTWGKEIDSTKDIMQFEIPVEKTSTPCEYFTMLFQDNKNQTVLLMAWDDIVAKLPIGF
ncbi:MAG: DUF2911 domain-containing protein [Ferruginibacter sp.]